VTVHTDRTDLHERYRETIGTRKWAVAALTIVASAFVALWLALRFWPPNDPPFGELPHWTELLAWYSVLAPFVAGLLATVGLRRDLQRSSARLALIAAPISWIHAALGLLHEFRIGLSVLVAAVAAVATVAVLDRAVQQPREATRGVAAVGAFEARRKRTYATPALYVMIILGTAWCGFWAGFQGDTPWEAWDRGWFAAWVVQFLLVASLLVLLWWRRAPMWMIVVTPIVLQFVFYLILMGFDRRGWFASEGDYSDASTFSDAFVPLTLSVAIGTAAIGAAALVSLRLGRSGNADRRASA
jgi:hypothetical protein